MAKRKKKAKRVDATELMGSYIAAAEKKLGPGAMYTADKHVQHHVGVPFPALALEYLFGSNILFLGAGYGLAGPSQSFKSSLAIELGRLLASYGSFNFLTETEGGKISGAIIKSIYGDLASRMRMRLVSSVEAAQKDLSFNFGWIQKEYPDRNHMFGMFLDSLNGPSSDERHEAIKKQGHATRDFPVEALLWTKWLQDWLPKLTGWPVVLIFVNHQKLALDGKKGYRHPGGDAQDFYSTVYMHVQRVRTNEGIEKAITQLTVKTVKHSFMLPGRKINTVFVLDKATRRLYFDWDHSTADLLTDKDVKPRVADIIEVSSNSTSLTALTRHFTCKRLGLKEVSGTELGQAINTDAALKAELREALLISTHTIWDGVMPESVTANTLQAGTAQSAALDTDVDVEDDLDLS